MREFEALNPGTPQRWLRAASLVAALLCVATACAPTSERVEPPGDAVVTEAADAVPMEPVEQLPPEKEEPAEPEPLPPLVVVLTGDIMLGTDFPEDRMPADDGVEQLAAARPYLQSADVGLGNLEGVLMDGGEPVKQCKDPSLCYLFRSPARFAVTLRDAGFTALSLANNHAMDFGYPGREASMASLDAVGIYHSGQEGDIASWSQDGYRIAFIAFAPNIGSFDLLSTEAAAAQVATLAESHDLVFVSFHGGAEGIDALHIPAGEEFYYGESRGDVVVFSHAMVDAGADLVFGHGPHVPRALESYRSRLIAYSLGNFATYYGISVSGLKGVAPLLEVTLDQEGNLLRGRIVSLRQHRPTGLAPDPDREAFELIRRLTAADFCGGRLKFSGDGGFLPRGASPPRPSGESSPPESGACGRGECAPCPPVSQADLPSPRNE